MGVNKATAYKFLRTHSTAVLSTINSQSSPSSSAVHYVVTPKKTIGIVSKDQTSKVRHLKNNSKVALSVIDSELPIAVNISGKANILEDTPDKEWIMREGWILREIGKIKQLEGAAPVLKYNRGDFVVIEISPEKIQYTDFSRSRDDGSQYIFDL